MRIVQLLPELNEGGVERGVVELNRELVRRDIDSVVISAGGKLAAQIEQDGGRHCRFDVVSKNLLTAPWRVWRLRWLLRSLQPDIVHARSRVPAWLAWLANRRLRLPFVTTVHGFNSVSAYSRVMTFGDRVICVSGAIRDYVRQHYGVAEEKLTVIPRGVDLQAFDPANLDQKFIEDFRRKQGLAGRFVVTSVGRITQLKDYETFIAAVTQVRQTIPEVIGLIVGGVHPDRQDYFQRLQQQAADSGAADIIRFVGSQSRVAEIYALSDVVVSSSKKPESFGRSAAEALAMGVPVVASRHGGVLDIVREGETGFLFTPGDAAELAAKIIVARGHMFTGLRQFVGERFTLERMTEQTLAVYRELLGGRMAQQRTVLFWGRFDPDYSRNRIVRQVLREAGWTIVDFQPKLSSCGDLEAWLRRLPLSQLVWVPCFRQRDVAAAARFSRRRGVPMVCDPLISAYDKQVFEKRKFAEGSPRARRLQRWEQSLLRRAELVLADTPAHADFFRDALGVPQERLCVVPVGAEEGLFRPVAGEEKACDAPLEVFFYGSFIPLQGPQVIVEAARRYQGPPVVWRLLGSGPLRAECERLAVDLPQVAFEDWLPYPQLPERIARADILLGIFGTTPKAQRVIPNKVYQATACGKPLVTLRAPSFPQALREAKESGFTWVPAGDADALAAAVAELAAQPQRLAEMGRQARQSYDDYLSVAHIRTQLGHALGRLGLN